MNYLLFYEQVESILETQEETVPEDAPDVDGETVKTPPSYTAIEKNLSQWIDRNGFTRPGLTIEDLEEEIGTNRTYLSG